MAGPWARLIGFGSRGYWICEKPKDIFPTPNPSSSEGEVRGAGWGKELKGRWGGRTSETTPAPRASAGMGHPGVARGRGPSSLGQVDGRDGPGR